MSPLDLATVTAVVAFGVAALMVLIAPLYAWGNPIPMGTRSLLYGSHTFWIHPIFVAVAWCKLWGFPVDPRIWVAFLVHDWGYWGKPNMDGPEGIQHPELGARLMHWLCRDDKWYWFTLLHSREMCRVHNAAPSRLCMADKLAVAYTPAWLFVLQIWLTGEWHEIVRTTKYEVNVAGFSTARDLWDKHRAMQQHLKAWVRDHIDEVNEADRFLPAPELDNLKVDDEGEPTFSTEQVQQLLDGQQQILDGEGLTPNQVRRRLGRPPKELTFPEVVAFCLGKPVREASPEDLSAAYVAAEKLLSGPDDESVAEEVQP